MAVSQASYAKNLFNAYTGVGDKIIQSDATFVIDGYEDAALLIKNFPYPILTVGEPIEIPLPMGLKANQVSQVKINQQGSVTMTETVSGHCFRMLADLLNNGGEFTAKVYEGTQDHYLRYYQLYKCSIQLDPGERGWEDNSTTLDLTGNLSYHYFGDKVDGQTTLKPAFANQAV